MGARFFTPDGTLVAVADILQPLLEHNKGRSDIVEMSAYIVDKVKQGHLVMDPSADKLRDMVIAERVTMWTAAATDDGSSRFFVARPRGRFDRQTGQIASIAKAEQQRFVDSIRQSMMVELPAAYKSQARLWGELDSTLDPDTLADACAVLVTEAVKAGIAEARKVRMDKAV